MTVGITEDLRKSASRSGFQIILEKPLQDGMLLDSIHSALAGLPSLATTSGISLRESI
jgi:hypothetical protein